MLRVLMMIGLFLSGFTAYVWADSSTDAYHIGGKEFMPDTEYFFQLCRSPLFTCRHVKPHETWRGLFPDDKERDLMMRINRTNVPLQYRYEILLPKDAAQLDYQKLSPFPRHRNTHGKKLLYINLDKFAFAAYDQHGDRVLWGPASGGKAWCGDTHSSCLTATGTFHIYRIKGKDCQSGTYPVETHGGAEMPYCMYYHKGFAIHGSTLSGFINRSRGCIRLFDRDAKWLNKHFVQIGTQVIVKQ